MTAPRHTDALRELIEQRAERVTVPLLELVERVRRRMVALGVDPARLQGTPFEALIDQLIAEMTIAAGRADRAGSDQNRVSKELEYRTDRVRAFARELSTTERPTLTKALLIASQALFMASALTAALSDYAVAQHTRERRKALSGRLRGQSVLMWVPERDACAQCLRYAGIRLLTVREEFPGGLSYDPQRVDRDAPGVPGPPLHPACRCELQLVPKGRSEPASRALRREADRSILRGFALESEGDASRRRAAEALLASGVRAPDSVKADARRRLREGGHFGREVPGGG
jgi:hypothetical protein